MANMQDVLLIPRHKPSWHKLSGEGGWEGGGVSELSAGSLFSGPQSRLDRLRLWGPDCFIQPLAKKTSKLKTLLLESQR